MLLRVATKRGFTTAEVEKVIQDSSWEPAELGRLQCRKKFLFVREWNGKVYETKQVRPIFVEQADEILVITVYTLRGFKFAI